ncbi:MAG: 30S ribosomal protein S1 [Bacteroidia bacterium]|nr:30S ribosomal protein S1 [Bacteroidia bacterium]
MVDEKKTAKPQVLSLSGDDSFDWDEAEGYNEKQRMELEKLYAGTLNTLQEQQILTGTVVAIDNREVVINVGFKSEGVIPVTEFRDVPGLKVGDKVEVFLETIENRGGEMILSRRTANSIRSWAKIKEALDGDEVVTGTVARRTKGGFVVDIGGIEAFLPGSQIDVKPIRDYDSYVGKQMDFKVVKINELQHNVVISHKALIEKDIEAQKAEIINNLEKGQVLEGTVKNITSFGVFIDLGGVDGLLHITDISWGRINSPDEVLALDQRLNVVVLDFDDDKKRISLGLKQLEAHPWDSISDKLAVNAQVKGRIVTIADYGVFVEIQPGIEGLVHVSEMSWSSHPKSPSETYSVGQEIDAVILAIDTEERKMSLGIKQLQPDPWQFVASKYTVGSRHTGTVRNITNYGLFVELEEGVDGLIHVQDLSWNKKINHPSEFIGKDQTLEVVVLELDLEQHRLRLGHKQLTEDPWETLETVFPVGSVHSGTLSKVDTKGAVVELPYGIEGFVPAKQLKVEQGKEALREGAAADFKVIEFNKDSKRIVLSHTATWEAKNEASDDEVKEFTAKKGKKTATTTKSSGNDKDTLGDFDALAGLKESMLANEKQQKPDSAE